MTREEEKASKQARFDCRRSGWMTCRCRPGVTSGLGRCLGTSCFMGIERFRTHDNLSYHRSMRAMRDGSAQIVQELKRVCSVSWAEERCRLGRLGELLLLYRAQREESLAAVPNPSRRFGLSHPLRRCLLALRSWGPRLGVCPPSCPLPVASCWSTSVASL
jgi:hypothetical protein